MCVMVYHLGDLHGELGLGETLQDEVVAVLQRVVRNGVHSHRRCGALGATASVRFHFAVIAIALCTWRVRAQLANAIKTKKVDVEARRGVQVRCMYKRSSPAWLAL